MPCVLCKNPTAAEPADAAREARYQAMGGHRQSKRTIILNVADPAGGAHLDPTVPDEHVTLAEPPFAFMMDNGGKVTVYQPNVAYGVVALAGYEMQDCLERHFPVR
jgi:hypothetical protein